MQDLQRGTWIELCLESGERRAVRLTWISPTDTSIIVEHCHRLVAKGIMTSFESD